MKRNLLFLLFLCVSTLTFGQSVLGIPFGSSYEETKQFLFNRNVGDDMWEQDGTIIVTNGYIGGIPFNLGYFYFQFDHDKSYLYSACFSDIELTANQAKAKRELFADIIKEKYYDSIKDYVDETGFKRYDFGVNPLDEDKPLGKIFIHLNKKSNKYDTVLYYGPIYYVGKNADF